VGVVALWLNASEVTRSAAERAKKFHCQPKKKFSRNFKNHPTSKKNFSAPMPMAPLVPKVIYC
jgi:hypothetical protein